ncbi:hypothetical protein BM221_005124 [Beauveria bassiana]|uniref:Cyclin-like F-box n=1 Tax=Beauveria bassiana TaxID=176275 RepID=A0A2N6NMN5_BEABA|nr:hypothetical protein BM221_005124 [Beauveria bassiana]
MFKSKRSLVALLCALVVLFLALAEAAPRNGNNGNSNSIGGNGKGNGGRGGNGGGKGGGGNGKGGNGNRNGNGNGNGNGRDNNGQQLTPQEKAAQEPDGISEANDGSTILDMTVNIRQLPIRFRVSAPADQFTQESGVPGGQAAPNTDGNMGINVLLHGDGGQSFFAYPNQGVKANLMGVAVLAPDKDLKWGSGDRNGVQRPNGAEHSAAVNELITDVLPQMVAFNQSNVFFTGVSGGSLTLSGFFMPAFMGNYPNAGVLLSCGALEPQVPFEPQAAAALANTRIHLQSTFNELDFLQPLIPQSLAAYEREARDQGLSNNQIGALQTVDNTPKGGHCAFDEKDFGTGVQLMADSFANIMLDGGNGRLGKAVKVLKPVVGNENPKFGKGSRK